MARVVFLLMAFAFIFLVEVTTISAASLRESGIQQKFFIRLKKNYEDHGVDGIHKELKDAWAVVMKAGQTRSSSEMDDLQRFLKKLGDDYNRNVKEKVYSGLEDEWNHYIKFFGKEYTPKERKMRKALFKKNKEHTEKHNKLFKQGKTSYSIKLNHFSDMTAEELSVMTSPLPSNSTFYSIPRKRVLRDTHHYLPQNSSAAAFVDWRISGFVTGVINQGNCNSCYAIIGIGALEAYHRKVSGKLVPLSVQNILDCTWTMGNKGCQPGLPHRVFEYARCRGVLSEERYPYTMNASRHCKWKKEDVVATDHGYRYVPYGDELTLQHAVSFYGPVAASIGITDDFFWYEKGIYNPPNCKPISHGLLIVGYGSNPTWGDYWIGKNSYGSVWGEDGYVMMARNKNNLCDVATFAVFPI